MECPECGNANIVEDYTRGDVVCASCGLVVESGIAEREPFLPCSTKVDANAPALSRPPRGPWRRTAEGRIREMCERAGLSSVTPVAQEIWNIARARPGYKVRKGNNATGFLAAAVFHACKVNGVPRTPKELCSTLGADLSAMRRMVKETQAAADSVSHAREYSFSAPDPVSIIHRYLYKLDLCRSDRALLKECARDLWKKYAGRLETYERDSIIAGMLYFMYGGNRDHVEKIADACCVCKNTVKGVFAKISEWESSAS